MTWSSDGSRLDQDIFDALAEFIGQLLQRGEALAQQFGVPVFCIKALRRLDGPMTMKELGQQLRVDRSFVTVIADELEQRGLARREPDAADRRIKKLVLTPDGLELKARLERTMLAQVPWSQALDVTERESLLAMIRKMNTALAEPPASQAASEPATTTLTS